MVAVAKLMDYVGLQFGKQYKCRQNHIKVFLLAPQNDRYYTLFLKLLLPLLQFNNLSSFYNRIMIRQDYFLRLLEEFATALATMMKKKEDERDDSLKDLYRQYVGDYTLLRNMSVDELIAYAANEWDDKERTDRLEMAAELLYAEGSYKTSPLRNMLLEKAYLLFAYVDEKQSVYSIERKTKIARLHSILHE